MKINKVTREDLNKEGGHSVNVKVKRGKPTTSQEWDAMAHNLSTWLLDENNHDLELFANEYLRCSFHKLRKLVPADSLFEEVFDLALGTIKRRREDIYSKTNILKKHDIWKDIHMFYDQDLFEFKRYITESRKSSNVTVTNTDNNEECKKESERIKAIMMARDASG